MEITFGKYTLLKKLGDGGMAEVFLAEMKGSTGFSKFVAIKRIHAHLSHDSVFTESFINEARLGGHLNHHNIVQTLDFGQIDGYYYLAMEYVQGIDLQKLLQRCQDAGVRMPLPLAIDIGYQICEGLAYGHLATDSKRRPLKMIHRDLKPSNIMINNRGVVKIADFGVARAESNVAHTQMAQGNPKGTVAYMSPEQALGLLNIDQRADIFSLGSICFELATNHRLYTASTYLGALRQAQDANTNERLQLLKSLPEVSGLLPVLQRALAPERDNRYENSRLFAKELRRAAAKAGKAPPLSEFIERVLPGSFKHGSQHTDSASKSNPLGTSFMIPRASSPGTSNNRSQAGRSTPSSSGNRRHSQPNRQQPQQQAVPNEGLQNVESGVTSDAWPAYVPPGEESPPLEDADTIMHLSANPQTMAPAQSLKELSSSTPPTKKAGSGRFRAMAGALLSTVLLLSVGAFVAITLMGKTTKVNIVSDPPSATIRLPGGQTLDAPQIFEVPDGGLSLSLSAPGYRNQDVNIPEDIPSGAEWRVRLIPLPALLNITLGPGNALLTVNGASTAGGSPYIMRDLPLDEAFEIEATLEGYETFKQTVTLRPGKDQNLEITLKAEVKQPTAPPKVRQSTTSQGRTPKKPPVNAKVEMGYLACNALPKAGGSMWAKVFVDGKYIGNTPMIRKKIPVGKHNIRLISESGVEKDQNIVVKAGKLSRVLITFD